MKIVIGDVFADTLFWAALVVRTDQHHARAVAWSRHIGGLTFTTEAVLTETLNMLARPASRAAAVALVDNAMQRADVRIISGPNLWARGWQLYRTRPDKGWSLTDCISFLVMGDHGLTDALTADDHFRQAGFRPLLQSEPGPS